MGLVGEDQEDQEEDEEEDEEGEEEDTPIMDCTVSTATAPAATLTLQARRSLGRPPRWMEQVKMERLRQVNAPRMGHLSPTLPPAGQTLPGLTGKGPCSGRSSCGGVPVVQPSPRSELSCTELTVLSLLRDRRDSGVSAASSAYLSGSRRSSGVSPCFSPCFSSRRSSKTSQSEHGQHGRQHSLSATDSYDPISTDASRRSSEASQGGGAGGGGFGGLAPGGGWGGGYGGAGGGGTGSRGVLSLTPAQHYHLKAKYAAATGGPPPTPLPSMERGSPKTRTTRDGQDTNHLTLPPLVRPRRCSDGSAHSSHTGYRGRAYYPGEGPGNSVRRASDPVRTREQGSFGLPQIQRFGSLNNMRPLPPLVGNHYPIGEGHALNLQNCTRSEGDLQRGVVPCPPSIMEQSALEALALEHDEALLFRDEDVLPDDLMQFLHSQEHEIICGPLDGPCRNSQRFADGPEESQNFHNPPEHQRGPEALNPGEDGMPIQWNEVSSGSADTSPPQLSLKGGRWPDQSVSASTPFDCFGDMAEKQRVPADFANQHFPHQRPGIQPVAELTNGYLHPHRRVHNPTMQQLSCGMNSAMETAPSDCKDPRRNSSHAYNTAQPDFSQNALGPFRQSCTQQANRFQSRFPSNLAITRQIGNVGLLQGVATHGLSRTSTLLHQPENRSSCQPQPRPTQQCSTRHGNSTSCLLASRVSELKLETEDHLLASSCSSVQHHQSVAECFDPVGSSAPPQQPGLLETLKTESLVSDGPPRSPQVTSTVDASPAVCILDNVGLDFSSILDESLEQGGLFPAANGPSVLQGLSQTSSRLTTPRLSAMFHGLPPSTSNMAIGDMSSLLTTLAEESKILAIMQ